MLIFTSYLDLRKREVEDKVWIIFGAIGLLIEAYESLIGSTGILTLIISVGLAAVVGFGVFYFGLYGGADAKALVVLAILVPDFQPHVGIYPITPLIVLTNGVLLSMSLPICLLVLNASRLLRRQRIFEGFQGESLPRKLLACFLGYKSNGKPKDFQFSMENKQLTSQIHSGQRRFDFGFMKDEFESEPGTWVTPGLPLLVFFTLGFFVLLFYGDLVIGLVALFSRLL